jgi:hypothetical protein
MIKILLLGKAARATRAVSSGTGATGCGRSDMGLLLDQGKVDQDVTLRMLPVKGLRQQYQICGRIHRYLGFTCSRILLTILSSVNILFTLKALS